MSRYYIVFASLIDVFVRNGILTEFSVKNRAGAIAVSIFEYNEEQHLKLEKEETYKNGKSEGVAEGREEGEDRFVQLLQILENEGRDDDIHRAISDKACRE